MKNEIMNTNEMVNMETGELTNEIVVDETPDYKVVKLPNGKYRKDMKYKEYHSRTAETEEEKIELYRIFNDSEGNDVIPLSRVIGEEISIEHVFIQPYESFDEKTGNNTQGVTTTIQATNGAYYATSSKSVYYTIENIFKTFGFPTDDHYKPVTVEVTGTKRQMGIQIDLKLIGIEQ